MVQRIVLLLLPLLALCGCVLQSPAPLFAEGDGEPALQQLGQRFRAETFEKGQWTTDGSIGTFTPAGRHYVLSNDKDNETMDMLFVPIAGGQYAVQVLEEAGKPPAYIIADVNPREVLLRPLFCDELKALPKVEETVSFSGSDCTVKGALNPAAFAALARELAPARMRLVPVN